jgi:hypothetical protein
VNACREPGKKGIAMFAWTAEETDFEASCATRCASSARYISAAGEWYFFFVSESFTSARPACLEKKSVAEAFPPTFMVRSWPSCQVSRLVELEAMMTRSVRVVVEGKKKEISTSQCIAQQDRTRHDAPNEGDVNAHVPMNRRALEADVHAVCDAGPCRVARLAVKADLYIHLSDKVAPKAMSAQGQSANGQDTRPTRLIGLLALEDLEDGLRLRLSGLGHRVRE